MKSLLDFEFYSSDLGTNITIRDFLKQLLRQLWLDGADFSGKRPFGNGGWKLDLYSALIKAGKIDGQIDEDGDILSMDDAMADGLVRYLINKL